MPPKMRAYVRTAYDDNLLIAAASLETDVEPSDCEWGYLVVDRQTARMIARRINECLDETVKR